MKNAMVKKGCPELMVDCRFQEFLDLLFSLGQPIKVELLKACEELVEVLCLKLSFNAGIFLF